MPDRAAFFILPVLLAVLLPGPLARADEVSTVTITNSGSTNMSGFSIDVRPDGAVSWQSGGEAKAGALPPDLAGKLFSDVQAAQPLDNLGQGGCAKSASFGTVTRISAEGKTSPDISCEGDVKIQTLYADAQAVQKALGVSPSPRHHGVPAAALPPSNSALPLPNDAPPNNP